MSTVTNAVLISGAAAPVFDLVTSARFWPQWHPASEAVGGVIQRPFQTGDMIHERGQIAGVPFQVAWKVIDHIRPARVVLQAEVPPARITYSFQARGDAIEFRRELEYDPAVFRAMVPHEGQLEQFMHAQSERALQQLKELVETILRQEAAGP